MISVIIKTALVLIVVFTAMVVGTNAQRATVKIDFDFRIGQRVYPAGVYNIEETNPSNPGVLRVGVERAGNAGLALARRHESVAPSRPMLVFDRFGGTYYLTELFLNHSRRGYAFSIPKGRSDGRVTVAATDGRPPAKAN